MNSRTKSLWHCFPRRYFEAIVHSIQFLESTPKNWLTSSQRVELIEIKKSVEEGFAIKSNLNLDSHRLVNYLQFVAVMAPEPLAKIAREVLILVRARLTKSRGIRRKSG